MLSIQPVAAIVFALSAVPALAAGTAVNPSFDPHHCAKPEYPQRWHSEGDSASVVVAYLVGTDGKVVASKVLQSSGDTRVDRASVRAVERCTFAAAPAAPSWSKVRYSWIVE